MRSRWWLKSGPWWRTGLASGAIWGAIMGVFTGLERQSWFAGLAIALIGTPAFGLTFGFLIARQRDRMLGPAALLPPERLQSAVRASFRGPVPSDPVLHAAALTVARGRLAEIRRQRRWFPLVLFAALAVSVALAIGQSVWWLLAVAFWVVVGVLFWRAPGRYQRRIRQLEDG